MIDTQEPKDGDFARYVENLSRLPPGQGQIVGPRAPGSQADEDAKPRRDQLKAMRKALEARKNQLDATTPGSLFGRSASAPEAAAPAASAARPGAGIGRLLGRLSSLMVVGGVVLIGLSLMDELPWKPDTETAIQVLISGFILRFLTGIFAGKAVPS